MGFVFGTSLCVGAVPMFSFGMTLDYSKAKGIDFSFTAQSDNFLLGFNKLSYKQVELKSEQSLLKRNLPIST